jgi:hypothetical protein
MSNTNEPVGVLQVEQSENPKALKFEYQSLQHLSVGEHFLFTTKDIQPSILPGALAMHNSLLVRAANNYHGKPQINAGCQKDNELIVSWANTALEEVKDCVIQAQSSADTINDDDILAVAHRSCTRYHHNEEIKYLFTKSHLIEFALKLLANK